MSEPCRVEETYTGKMRGIRLDNRYRVRTYLFFIWFILGLHRVFFDAQLSCSFWLVFKGFLLLKGFTKIGEVLQIAKFSHWEKIYAKTEPKPIGLKR